MSVPFNKNFLIPIDDNKNQASLDYLEKNMTFIGVTANMEYEWFAYPWSSDDDTVWVIRKHTYDVSNNRLTTKRADGTATFDKVWDDRATYTY